MKRDVVMSKKVALEIAEEYGLLRPKPVEFPMETNHRSGLATGQLFSDPTQYRCLVRRLIYLIFELFSSHLTSST